MPKKPNKLRHLTIIREALGLSQAQFAEHLGVSASMIKKVEEGTRPGSQDLISRIYAETGRLFHNRDDAINLIEEHHAYSKDQHAAWLEEVQFSKESAAIAARLVLKLVELMLVAAARPGVHKSYQVFNGLIMAVERVKDDFHMEKHIEAELRERRSTETVRHTVRELRANPVLARMTHFQDSPKLRNDETLTLEKTVGWLPTREMSNIWFQHKEFISEILKKQAGELAAEDKAKLEALNQNLDKKMEREMDKFLPPGSLVTKKS